MKEKSRGILEKGMSPSLKTLNPFLGNMTTGICRTYRTEGMPRTQLGTECMAFASKQQNALCVNGTLADIARRQFVPTNCACFPCPTVGEIRP